MKTRIEEAARDYATIKIHSRPKIDWVLNDVREAFITGAEFMQKEFDTVKHQLDYAEKILTEVQADKFKLKAQNEVMKKMLYEILCLIELSMDSEHNYYLWLRENNEALKKLREV